MTLEENVAMAREIARAVAARGGRTFFVGGFVRDRQMGRTNKDVDLEVHGIPAQELVRILDTLGTHTQMGASFGVYGLKHYQLDIALPRKERLTGRGHRDFAIFTDPFLGTEKAAKRRDFTVNAMMEDVCTGELVDPFGGREDLKKGILRHVCSESFVEDPLRVLRCAQFAARFGFRVAEETIALCREMDLSTLPRERIYTELEKALMKSDKPSVFFETLRQMDQLSFWFQEVEALIGVPQDPVHHPEGDVWNHTMGVMDGAASLREQACHPVWLMLSALCHDLGKAYTTTREEGRIRSIGHERFLEPTTTLLNRLTGERELKKYVENAVELHMFPNILAEENPSIKTTNRMFDRSICPEDLLLLSKADRIGQGMGDVYGAKEAFLRQRLAVYRQTMALPCVTGRDLIEAGAQPGKEFSQALDFAHKLHLAGIEKQTALKQTLGYLRTLRKGQERKT